jgi:MOSC domain-containing protein YiiM
MSGRVEAIWSKRSHGGVMDPARDVIAVEGKGLEGDANFGATRQVTVIEKEVFDRILAELPGADPAMRRANIMVSGIRLEETRDHILTVGDVQIRLRGETRPCDLMDSQCQGLRGALDANWGGGAHGSIIQGGEVRVGDAASIEAPVAVSP